jgi:hypothetical protein
VIADDDHPAGIAYRRLEVSRVPALLPVLSWGEERKRRRLLGEAARRTRTVAVLDTDEPGGAPTSAAPGLPRGGSLLAVWPTPSLSQDDWPFPDVQRWRVGFADLENVL